METYFEQEKRKQCCSKPHETFPLVDYLQRSSNGICNHCCYASYKDKIKVMCGSTFHICMWRKSLWPETCNVRFENHHVAALSLDKNRHFRKWLKSEPTKLTMCTVVLLKRLVGSLTQTLSRDQASYHETYFHKGQMSTYIKYDYCTALPNVRVLWSTESVYND